MSQQARWWNWLISIGAIVCGIVLCATGIGAGIGAGLIVSGGLSLTTNILSAADVNSKTVSIVSSILSMAAGLILLATPLAGLGASLMGSGIGGIVGGFGAERFGFNFTTGAAIVSFIGGAVHKWLQNARIIGKRVRLTDLKFNPNDEFVKNGPSDRAINYWTKILGDNPKGYNTIPGLNGEVEPIKVILNSGNMLANGHHRVYVLLNRIGMHLNILQYF